MLTTINIQQKLLLKICHQNRKHQFVLEKIILLNYDFFPVILLQLKSFKGSRLFIRHVNYFVENRGFPYKRL